MAGTVLITENNHGGCEMLVCFGGSCKKQSYLSFDSAFEDARKLKLIDKHRLETQATGGAQGGRREYKLDIPESYDRSPLIFWANFWAEEPSAFGETLSSQQATH